MSMYSYTGYSYCVARNCKRNSNKNPELSYFRFPKDQERCASWIAKIKKDDFRQYTSEQCYQRFRLCSLHFEDKTFSSLLKNRLKRTALPTLLLDSDSDSTPVLQESSDCCSTILEGPTDNSATISPKSKPSTSQEATELFSDATPVLQENSACCSTSLEVPTANKATISPVFILVKKSEPGTSQEATKLFSDSACQTSSTLINETPQVARLRSKYRALQRRYKRLEVRAVSKKQKQTTISDVLQYCDSHLNEKVATFIKTQIMLANTKSNGFRYSNEYKKFASTLYFLAPNAYKFLRKTFHLPSKSTLWRILRAWDICLSFEDFINYGSNQIDSEYYIKIINK